MAIGPNQPGYNFGNEVWVLLGLASVVVFLRCFARIQSTSLRQLKLDDWAMKVALTLFVFTGTSARLIAATTKVNPEVNPNHMPLAMHPAMANNDMTDEYRANLDPASVEYQVRVAASKLHLTAWSLYVSTLWCLKLCIAVFYTRLTGGLSFMKIRIHIAYVAIGVSYIVVMATILGACRPFNHYWQINPNPGGQCILATSEVACYVVVVLNVLTDLYLLHLPILLFWDAKMSRVKKLLLTTLFSGGVFVITAGILRTYFILTGGRQGGAQAAHWGMREAFVAFVIGNVPMIYGGARIWLRKVRDSKMTARIRSMIISWPGADRVIGVFRIASREEVRGGPENFTRSKNFARLNGMEVKDLSSAKSLSPSQIWSHSCMKTDVTRSGAHLVERDPQNAIHVTRGINVDFGRITSHGPAT